MTPRSIVLAAGIAGLLWLLPAGRALGFCRESLETEPNGACFEEPGVPLLTWPRSCVAYAFNHRVFERIPALDESQVRADFEGAFAAWAAIDCGREPFEVVQTDTATASFGADFQLDVENESVVSVLTAEDWADANYDPDALALTTLFHDLDTGEIFDVDMELNAGLGEFTDCDEACAEGEIDLLNTVTHEAGHFLGLGHTSVDGATMAAYGQTGDIDKRTLEPDDEDGYCALELPEHGSSDSCDTPVYSAGGPSAGADAPAEDGCAVAAAGASPSGPPVWPALAALAWFARRRRACRTRARS